MSDHDVIILGGGLAGLTLALQIKGREPSIDVAVIERRTFPVPEAACKVGESSVEVGARYFADVLGLRPHLEQEQLPKLGLRFFFGADGDFSKRGELGGNVFLPSGSFQIDRGRFENHLAEKVVEAGITLHQGAKVKDVQRGTGGADHDVEWIDAESQLHQQTCRWVADATGRASFCKRRWDLADPGTHRAGSFWFRIDEKIAVDDWSDDASWRARCEGDRRWLSTNHLMGPGYWVWLIPLASGATSVGIVAAHSHHDYADYGSIDKAFAWIERHEPQAHQALAPLRDKVMDGLGYKDFSYGCKRVFGERWALVGEAGAFLDPFYSPGSDFIAYANTFTSDLIVRDLEGGADVPFRTEIYESIYQQFFAGTLGIYRDMYGCFGNGPVMAAKIIWDFAYYWAIPGLLFFQDKLTDISLLGRVRDILEGTSKLSAQVQGDLKYWYENGAGDLDGRFVDIPGNPLMARLNGAMLDTLDTDAVVERMQQTYEELQSLAADIRALSRGEPLNDSSPVLELAVPVGEAG